MSATLSASPPAPASVRRRRPDLWKTWFFVVAAVALVGGVAWALLGSSFFVVRSVQVTGAATSLDKKVIVAAGLRIGTPLVRVDPATVARRVERITLVQSASVRRSWPDSVVIEVVPRRPTFDVRAGRGYEVADSYGVVLGRTSRPHAGLVLLKASSARPAALRASAAVLAAGAVVRQLPGWLRRQLTAVAARGVVRVVLFLRPGITIVWGGTARAAAKAEEVAVLLRTKVRYIDVSDPGSAITRRT